jgi:hypothetical protein
VGKCLDIELYCGSSDEKLLFYPAPIHSCLSIIHISTETAEIYETYKQQHGLRHVNLNAETQEI